MLSASWEICTVKNCDETAEGGQHFQVCGHCFSRYKRTIAADNLFNYFFSFFLSNDVYNIVDLFHTHTMYALPWLWVVTGKSRLCFNCNYCRTCDHTLLTHTGCLGQLHTSKVCNTMDCEIILIDKIILSRETTFLGRLQDGLAPTGDSSGTADALILKSCLIIYKYM